jgi:putative ABC transport system substrate-binding protein
MMAILPFAAQSQPREGVRRLGVLSALSEHDPIWSVNVTALTEALAALNWRDGDNIHIEWRGAAGDRAQMARFAEELIAQGPDVILAASTSCVIELRLRTKTIPIVFVFVTDPVGQGFVESLSHPGGNITGFSDNELAMGSKWLSLLAQITPAVKRVTVLYNPATAPFAETMLHSVTGAAPALGITVKAEPVREVAGIAAVIAALSQEAAVGLLDQRFLVSNHIRRPQRVCRTKYG